MSNPERPWLDLPPIELPIALQLGEPLPADTFVGEIAEHACMTVACVDTGGSLTARRFADRGSMGFYPASSIKWLTAAMIVQWLDRLHASSQSVLMVDDAKPVIVRDAVLAMLTHSDNHAFNLLHEAVGFEESHQLLRSIGCEHMVIRRNFDRPRRSTSRAIELRDPSGDIHHVAPREGFTIPLSPDTRPAPLGSPEANYATTDDLVRMAAWSLMGPPRSSVAFDLLTTGLAGPSPRDLAEGVNDYAISNDRAGWTVLSKPGWWPPDQANVDVAYLHDIASERHLFASAFVQAQEGPARQAIRRAARVVMESW